MYTPYSDDDDDRQHCFSNRYYGKYRGNVVDNIDPDALGRLYVTVPSVLGVDVFVWAEPCVPYAGPQVGFWAIPPIDANIWVEFEGGNLDFPIWVGCYWVEGEVPVLAEGLPEVKVFKTESCLLQFNDVEGEGGITIEVGPPALEVPLTISCNAAGISVSNGIGIITLADDGITMISGDSIVSVNEASVIINDGALEII